MDSTSTKLITTQLYKTDYNTVSLLLILLIFQMPTDFLDFANIPSPCWSRISPLLIKLNILNSAKSTFPHTSCHFPTPGHLYHIQELQASIWNFCLECVFFFHLIYLWRYKSHNKIHSYEVYNSGAFCVFIEFCSCHHNLGPFLLLPK